MIRQSFLQEMDQLVMIRSASVPRKLTMFVINVIQSITKETIIINVLLILTTALITLMLFVITVKRIITRKKTRLLVSQTLKTVRLMIMLFVKIVNQISTKLKIDKPVFLMLSSVLLMTLKMKQNAKLAIHNTILKMELFVIQTLKNVQNMRPQDQSVRLVLPRPERPMTDFTATISSQNVRPMF